MVGEKPIKLPPGVHTSSLCSLHIVLLLLLLFVFMAVQQMFWHFKENKHFSSNAPVLPDSSVVEIKYPILHSFLAVVSWNH